MSTMRTSLDHRQRIVLTTTVLFLFAVRSGLAAGGAVAATDSDGDGLDDSTENTLGTDPNDVDSDGNGVPDSIDSDGDNDGDGIADYIDGAQGGGY
jgi:hypothetical protein